MNEDDDVDFLDDFMDTETMADTENAPVRICIIYHYDSYQIHAYTCMNLCVTPSLTNAVLLYSGSRGMQNLLQSRMTMMMLMAIFLISSTILKPPHKIHL